MKKLLVLFMILLLALVGCGSEDEDGLKVVATLFPQYDFVRNIAGDAADTDLLLDLGTDAHSFDPTALDVMKIADADLFIYTGEDMELWAKKLLESEDISRAIESGKLKVLDLSKNVSLIAGHHENEFDMHIWTSPENASLMCDAICASLVSLDGENADYYKENLAAYKEKLATVDVAYKEAINGARLDSAFFGGSFAFAYLFDEYSLCHESVYEGCASHTEPSALDIARVVSAVKAADAKYVIYDTAAEKKTAQIIANESGADLIRLHAIHNISKAEFDSGEDYISLSMANAEVLGKALN